MSKNISTAMQTAVRATVTSIATCVEIRRKDQRLLRLTNHDADITVQGNVYRHDIPFSISAIKSSSGLQGDTTEMTLFADDVNILLADVKTGLFEYADVTIFKVNYEAPDDGMMTVRKGWFGAAESGHNRIVRITVTGLLKLLDFEVGRVYQPSCDADLGDKRCKVAIDASQIYSPLNPYHLGEWVFYYDPSNMTQIQLVNGGFEAGARFFNQTIPGWTRTPGSELEVSSNPGITAPTLGNFGPIEGTLMLRGKWPESAAGIGIDHGIYQDVDLVAAGIDPADIDNGQISLGYIASLLQGFYLLDPVKIRIELRDEDGEIVDAKDTGFIRLDTFDAWRDRGLFFHLLPGARKARLYVFLQQADDTLCNAAADDVRLYWWDHTLGNPNNGVVHQLTRLVALTDDVVYYPVNSSFEVANVANADNPTITGWTTGAGNWWQVVTALGPLNSGKEGLRFLAGGDDGGVVQQTYTISQTFDLVDNVKLDASRVLLGKYVGRMDCLVGWADTNASAATLILDFLDDALSVVDTITVLNAEVSTVGTGWAAQFSTFTIPALATKIRVVFEATSPVGDGAANVALDAVKFSIYDAERPKRSDPIQSAGVSSTVFNTAASSYTFDGNLVWKAVTSFVQTDVVDEVTSTKEFIGTDITGVEGQYETAAILWLSGDNAGLKNLVRTWDPDNKAIKLYFREPRPIQVGDRFQYVRNCQRRFLEDCQLVFGNQINFRGFPHVPGRLTSE